MMTIMMVMIFNNEDNLMMRKDNGNGKGVNTDVYYDR